MIDKPTVAIVPGAFHLHECMDKLIDQLHKLGYETKTTTLATVDNPGSTIADDVALLESDIFEPLLDSGKDIFVVLHSYAGYPGSVAIKGRSKKERAAKGLDGGIIGVAYMCAFVPSEGLSLHDAHGGRWAPWHIVDESAGTVAAGEPINVFYQDVDSEEARHFAALLKRHSLKALLTPATHLGFGDAAYDGRRAYIRAINDQAIPLFLQDSMIEQSGVQWLVKDSNTGHSPFLARPKELATILDEIFHEFARAP